MPFVSDEFVVRKVAKRRYALVEPVSYKGETDCWTIPAGFQTDYATIPAAVRWLFPQDDDYTIAAILHDAFCDALSGKIELENAPNGRDTDAIFRRVMRELGVPFARRWVIWTGVRWGAVANKHRRPGVARDLKKVIPISILVAPLVVPISLLVLIGGSFEWAVNVIFSWFGVQ